MSDRDLMILLGAGPGLGQALARRFAAGGCDVALIARDQERLDALADEIAGESGREVKGFAANGLDLADLRAAMSRIQTEMGPASVFIHSVSRWMPASGPALDPTTMMDEFTLSAGAALVGSQCVLPAMQAAGRGTILWTGSRAGILPQNSAAAPALAASKAALRALALASAKAFQDLGVNFATVTVNGTIKPGTGFAPERIAEAFWEVHTRPRDAWTGEVVFDGAD